ncbi:solute carrier family 67 member A1 isoform X1 [Pteropus medius]|uniref:solute carrier family 22 member 18 isoform X1 n=1 Tax=Pteropus vampyrus TaxID=132908 RepID=UPI00196B42DE|nr:solute carrier family 22 member 18 isoform X1 [Pteropus giganteus]XP_039696482.1 solute carrier family 22 member 18 isoform X1 [Pteropus giganteus]
MQGARARRGQSPAETGALGWPTTLLLTYALATLEFTCLFMQFSVLPYLSRSLGLDSVAFGYLQTTLGVLQLLGGPVFGRFADQRGARAAFTISFLASSAFYLLLAAACTPWLPGVALLFASRLPSALMHAMPTAQMVITDLTTPEERPTALSRLGLCVGSGTILGSLLGGTLSTACGIQCPVLVAFVANLLGAILSFTYIPANTKGAGAHGPAAPPGGPQASVFDLKTITRLLLQPGVLPVFLVKVVCGFPFGLFMVMFSIINMEFFQLEPAQASYLQSFFGILMMVIQGLLIGRLSRRFSEGALLWASVLVFCLVGLAMPVHSQHSHRQHADQGRLGLGHGDHAGPLRLCAAADPHHRAHPGWPPVPQIWRPRLRPRAVRRQLPCPPGPVEATDTPPGGEQSQVTLAPEHRLAINPLGTASGLISAGLPASRLGGGLGLRDGAWNAGGLPGGGACSWVPGFREGNITQVPPAPWSPSPRPMRSTLSASPEHPAPTPQPH